jgi:hypothetical protein
VGIAHDKPCKETKNLFLGNAHPTTETTTETSIPLILSGNMFTLQAAESLVQALSLSDRVQGIFALQLVERNMGIIF